jgi:hypothetical protein
MKTEQFLKNQMRFAISFTTIGVIALSTLVILGIYGNYNKLFFISGGITLGFLPVGIGTLISLLKVNITPEMKKRIEIDNEERNIYLNMKSGSTAFWIIYWVIAFLTILTTLVEISSRLLFPILLVVMPIVFYVLMGIYNRKN